MNDIRRYMNAVKLLETELFEGTRFRQATTTDKTPVSKMWARGADQQQFKLKPSTHRENVIRKWMFNSNVLDKLQKSNAFTNTVLNMPQYKGKLWRGEAVSPTAVDIFHIRNTIVLDYNTSFTTIEEVAIGAVVGGILMRKAETLIPIVFEVTNTQGADLSSYAVQDSTVNAISEVIVPKGTKFRVSNIKTVKDIDVKTELSTVPVPGLYVYLDALHD